MPHPEHLHFGEQSPLYEPEPNLCLKKAVFVIVIKNMKDPVPIGSPLSPVFLGIALTLEAPLLQLAAVDFCFPLPIAVFWNGLVNRLQPAAGRSGRLHFPLFKGPPPGDGDSW